MTAFSASGIVDGFRFKAIHRNIDNVCTCITNRLCFLRIEQPRIGIEAHLKTIAAAQMAREGLSEAGARRPQS